MQSGDTIVVGVRVTGNSLAGRVLAVDEDAGAALVASDDAATRWQWLSSLRSANPAWGGGFRVPKLHTPDQMVSDALTTAWLDVPADASGARPGETLVDLGSGDGRVCIAAAAAFGARALGVELDDDELAVARARAEDAGVLDAADGGEATVARPAPGGCAFVKRDIFALAADDPLIVGATVIFLHLLPEPVALLRPLLDAAMARGARVVSINYHPADAPVVRRSRVGPCVVSGAPVAPPPAPRGVLEECAALVRETRALLTYTDATIRRSRASALDMQRPPSPEGDPQEVEAAHASAWDALAPRAHCWFALLSACPQLGQGTPISHRDRPHGRAALADRATGAAGVAADAADAGAVDTDAGADTSLTYGEVRSFGGFANLLRDVLESVPVARARAGRATFADLGCGTGRALVAAALLPRALSGACGDDAFFSQCVGLELLPGLCEAAKSAGRALRELAEGAGAAAGDAGERAATVSAVARCAGAIEVIECDVLDAAAVARWAKADVVYAASTCFSPSLLRGIVERAATTLRPGAALVTLRAPPREPGMAALLDRCFDMSVCGPYRMSWGKAVAHVLVRRSEERDTPPPPPPAS